MTVKAVKGAQLQKPSGAAAGAAVRKPFEDAKKALNSPTVAAKLARMEGLTPKQLGAAIKKELPQLAKPMAQMIKLLDHPDRILEGIPDRAQATKLAEGGWNLIHDLVDKSRPSPPGGWGAKSSPTQLVNLLKSELGH